MLRKVHVYVQCMVGGYTENLKKAENCQTWGWALAQVWALAVTIRYIGTLLTS